MNFADDIRLAAGDEQIEAIVIGPFGWSTFIQDDKPFGMTEDQVVPKEKLGVVLEWDEASKLLDYEYDVGYGSPLCHAITAWTPNKVIWVTQYDGSTCVDWAPRNPVDHIPYMPGG